MKKIITSAGLVALGAASVHAQQYDPAPQLSSFQTTKPWSVSASLRGFYDDNYATAPSGPNKVDSFGFEVSPSVELNWTLPQTYVGLSYNYGLRYFEDRAKNSADHSHQADLKLNHTFSERYRVDASNSFLYSQEPELGVGTPLRIDTSYIRNVASADVTAELTEQLSSVVGYSNTFYDFDQEGSGSISSLLDRTEHLISANLRWQAMPSTVGILGYQYGMVGYDDENLLTDTPVIKSDVRDNRSHYLLVGADHSFNPQLNGSVRVGAQITDYNEVDRLGGALDDSETSPYADASVTWNYSQSGNVQVGVRHGRQATDISFINPNDPTAFTLDQEATTVYGQITRQILPRLNGSILGQYQSAEFEGVGLVGSNTDNFFLAGVNLSYEINKFLTGEAGYNYDDLDSDISSRSFSRNRVYLGIRANY